MMNNLTYIVLTFLLLVFYSSSALSQQPLSDKASKLVAEIATDNRLLGEAVGFAGTRTKQYERFEKLKLILNEAQLFTLLDHENDVVKCYAIWALTDMKSDKVYDALLKNLYVLDEVPEQFGCVFGSTSVADFSIRLLTSKYLTTADYYRVNQTSITRTQKMVVDSIVLYEGLKIEYLSKLLSDYDNLSLPYSLVNDYVNNGHHEAMPLLAKFQKKTDLNKILSLKMYKDSLRSYPNAMNYLFVSIDCFPDPYFKPFLEEYGILSKKDDHYSHAWTSYYQAIMNYDTNFYYPVINPILDESVNIPMRQYHLDFLSRALNEYPNDNNYAIILDLYINYSHVEENTFSKILEMNPIIGDSIAHNFFRSYKNRNLFRNKFDLLKRISNYLIQNDPDYYFGEFSNYIDSGDFTAYNEYLYANNHIEGGKLIPIIFKAIKNSYDGSEILASVKYLRDENIENLRFKVYDHFKRNDLYKDEYIGELLINEIEILLE